MKTTLDLPDELMRAVKLRAAEQHLKLREVAADALRAVLAAPATAPAKPLDPIEALGRRLVFLPDGTVTNRDGLDDPTYFDALESRRADSRQEPLHSPFGRD